jgi:Ca2+-binding EF-hand superfamily protein
MKQELSLADTDTLNWKAFLAATMDKSLVLREDKIRYAFDQFRHSDANYLTLEDFAGIFETEAQAKEVFDFLDTDNNGQVSFEDFRTVFEENIEVDQEE